MFWDIFVNLCNSINKSPNAVCKELGLSNAAATYWKRGSIPNSTTLKRIADYFDVSPTYLLRSTDKKASSAVSIHDIPVHSPDYSKIFGDGMGITQEMLDEILEKKLEDEKLTIPGIEKVSRKRFRMLGDIACGKPIYAEEHFETYVEASASIKADFCVTARGDSMINARIFDGDVVFIRKQPDVENGEIAAVVIGDTVTLKRVYKYPNRLELRPENPTHRVQNYEGEELENVRIIGKAVAFQSMLI